jgi:hypothetical protein
MTARPYFIAARITQPQHDKVRLAAEAKALKVSEWLRLAILDRLSGQDSAALSALRHTLALRIVLLNLLNFLAPPEPGKTTPELKGLWLLAEDASAKQLRTLLALDSGSTTCTAPNISAISHSVSARLTESQYVAATTAARTSNITLGEWFREIIVAQVDLPPIPPLLADRIIALRTILEDSIHHLTSDRASFNSNTVGTLSTRTDPALLRATITSKKD